MTKSRRVSPCGKLQLCTALTLPGPLYEVCAVGNAEAAKMLLDYGADVHDDDVSDTGAADITNSAMQFS